MYAAKFGIDEQKLMRKLWGDSFYNPKTKKWNKDATEGGVRAFCQFVLDTILKVEYITMHATVSCCFKAHCYASVYQDD